MFLIVVIGGFIGELKRKKDSPICIFSLLSGIFLAVLIGLFIKSFNESLSFVAAGFCAYIESKEAENVLRKLLYKFFGGGDKYKKE